MAKFAAVVASAGYTQSAKNLARTNGVLLLQPEDLPSLASKLRALEHDQQNLAVARFDGERKK